MPDPHDQTLEELMSKLVSNTFRSTGQESVEWSQKLSLLIQAKAACQMVHQLERVNDRLVILDQMMAGKLDAIEMSVRAKP